MQCNAVLYNRLILLVFPVSASLQMTTKLSLVPTVAWLAAVGWIQCPHQ
jgi:hypothetical protein